MWIVSVALYEKKKEKGSYPLEEPIHAKARKARVLRVQDEIDRCTEPLIGEQLRCLLPCLFNCRRTNAVVSCTTRNRKIPAWC